jgi:hypothetical protein
MVAEACMQDSEIDVVVKLYTGDHAQDYRNQEASALSDLDGIPNIPRILVDAVAVTVDNRPVY